MKGRPITTEEFERMLQAVEKVVAPKIKEKPHGEARPEQVRQQEQRASVVVESWRRYLRGLWWSGLRLSESLLLRWDAEPGAIVVDLSGRRPMLRIPGEAEKGNKDRLLPMAPEFAVSRRLNPATNRRIKTSQLE